jgi:hypothetical protein
MPKLKNLLIAAAAAMVSTSAALADTKVDDRSYLPPQGFQAQAKEPGVQAAPQEGSRLRSSHYGKQSRHGHRNYAARGFFPGIFSGLFR